MTQTDVYIEQKERKQQKKYDSDDDGEPERQGKKKKMKNVARGYPPPPPSLLFLPTCSPDPALSLRVDEALRSTPRQLPALQPQGQHTDASARCNLMAAGRWPCFRPRLTWRESGGAMLAALACPWRHTRLLSCAHATTAATAATSKLWSEERARPLTRVRLLLPLLCGAFLLPVVLLRLMVLLLVLRACGMQRDANDA